MVSCSEPYQLRVASQSQTQWPRDKTKGVPAHQLLPACESHNMHMGIALRVCTSMLSFTQVLLDFSQSVSDMLFCTQL